MSKRRLEKKSKVQINTKLQQDCYFMYCISDLTIWSHTICHRSGLNFIVWFLSKNSDYFPTHHHSGSRVFTVR